MPVIVRTAGGDQIGNTQTMLDGKETVMPDIVFALAVVPVGAFLIYWLSKVE